MAVYTTLSAAQLAALIGEYDVGALVSAKGIAEGVSNSNWLIDTTQARFILTMYEARVDLGDLPFFLGLLDHLAQQGSPVPRTIHDRAGAAFRMIDDKAVALIEFLPGVSVDAPSAAQARAVGQALAGVHLNTATFALERPNGMGMAAWRELFGGCGDA
ncbi:MAG: phosphotransferase, partial [Croceibacterium sp.]